MTELLAPAGDFLCAKTALYNGADAIYCASERFGARAYAKNLTLDELKSLLILAHSLNKKIYVTVNTIIKDSELNDCIEYVNELYKLGVDGLILADYAMINYVIDNLPYMEAHISTQCGVKCLEDVRFFENLGAKRVVLARENTFEEIKAIKENTKMPLEVFSHGALCVCYSGGCLMSSMLTLRSGNRGRCSQNCRREYTLYKNNDPFGEKGFQLSMKDLNTSSNLDKMIDIGIDSLKLEGRMKNPEYVKVITSEYRHKIDDSSYNPVGLSKVFHRAYTNGFIFGEDKGNIVDISKKSNEGDLVGEISSKDGKLTKIILNKSISVKDRIRIEIPGLDHYFTIDKLYNQNKKEVLTATGIAYLEIYKDINQGSKIFKMIDSTIDLSIDNTFKRPITINCIGAYNTPLTLKTTIDGITFEVQSDSLFDQASKKPIDDETLIKQLSKLNETSFYLENIINSLDGDLFMTIASINEARRKLVASIEAHFQNARELSLNNKPIDKINYDFEPLKLTAFCTNEMQYKALKDEGLDTIYFDNYIPYVDAKFNNIDSNYILAGNYGAIYKYSDKEITSDYSFNVINSKAVYDLHKSGVKYVTVSVEASHDNLKDIYTNYSQYGNNPNLEVIVYGRQNLMTTKYCPLRRYGECGKCKQNNYSIKDDKATFPIYHVNCITHIVNEKPLNLIDDLKEISKYSNRLRLQFTVESYDEVRKIVQMYKQKLNNLDQKSNYFDSKNNTRGYYRREIL